MHRKITFSSLNKAELTLAFQVLYSILFFTLKIYGKKHRFSIERPNCPNLVILLLYGQLPSIFRNISVDQRLKIQIYVFADFPLETEMILLWFLAFSEILVTKVSHQQWLLCWTNCNWYKLFQRPMRQLRKLLIALPSPSGLMHAVVPPEQQMALL